MYITITSDLIRQLAFDKIKQDELLCNYNIFYLHFNKSIDDVLQIFGGNFNARICNLIDDANIV